MIDHGGAVKHIPALIKMFDFRLDADVEMKEGRVAWNEDDGTVNIGMPGGNVVLQVGQELLVRCTNKTGSTIPNGTPVYISGAQGSRPTIAPTRADNAMTSLTFAGVTTEEISHNRSGYVVNAGIVRDVDTSDFDEGNILYLSHETAGLFTATPPPAPNFVVGVGVVLVSNNESGSILIRTKVYPDLNRIADVSLASQSAYQILLRDPTNSFWVNSDPKFGNTEDGNYTEFESDGTMKANGDATCFRDEYTALIGSRLESPASDITVNITEGSITFDDSCTLSDYVVMSPQINHDWKSGSNIEVHLHWWQTSVNIPNWLIQYRYQSNCEAKTTAWTPLAYIEHVCDYVAGTTNQITSFGNITLPSITGTSDILQLRLLRDTDNDSGLFSGTDPLSGNVDAMSYDIHIEVDTLGSRQLFTK